jgi:hypothetical protein
MSGVLALMFEFKKDACKKENGSRHNVAFAMAGIPLAFGFIDYKRHANGRAPLMRLL